MSEKSRQGAEDSARYFRYMAEFIGFTPEDAELIKQSKPYLEKHLPDIVSKFYSHLLRYPPTRKFFLKPNGALDTDYLQLRMRHLTNFWLRTADGLFDDEYARYVDYVGRAHTSHGADSSIYIPERYVIGQVGFVQHAINRFVIEDLHQVDEDLGHAAEDAWAKLMMVLLEMLARAYGHEREAETFDPLQAVDEGLVDDLASEAFRREVGMEPSMPHRDVFVARISDIPEGERKIIQVDGLSIGVFHHKGNWYAVRNSCLHRGGPVATGSLEGDVLTCPWHGFQYDVTTGELLVDPSARLDMYAVSIAGDEVHLSCPLPGSAPREEAQVLGLNEFEVSEVPPGSIAYLEIDGVGVAVFNIGGTFYATQSTCTHAGGPLDQGTLNGQVVTCPIHRARFDVTTGQVVGPPARRPLETYQVTITGKVGRVEKR
jgi:nitrite reductase/ring-hydroxylating ferredoxin subunit/hemoglobin-like flavoprotein